MGLVEEGGYIPRKSRLTGRSRAKDSLAPRCGRYYIPLVKVTATIPAERLRGLNLHQGDTLQVLSVGDTAFLVQISRPDPENSPRQGSATAWLRGAKGLVKVEEGESADDVRAAYYARKYGLKQQET